MNHLGIFIAAIFFIKFFIDLGKKISIRNVFSTLMCLQFLVGPFLVYNGFEEYQVYKMRVEEEVYFSYVTPAILLFVLGLYIKIGKSLKFYQEYSDLRPLKFWYLQNRKIPIVFVIVGFGFSFITNYVPGELAFVAYLISNLKFIGLFLLLLAGEGIPVKWFVLIYGSIIVSSFTGGMFHDLFIWSIFFLTIICFKFQYKTSIKLILTLALITSAIFVQSIKGELRERVWQEGEAVSIDLVEESYRSTTASTGGLFSKENLAPHITRINQGWIVARVMENVPANVPYANGELMYKYLEAAFLPRFLAPDKLKSGDKEIFSKYTGHIIQSGTSMGISSVGDAYINYGTKGGWIFMFFYGLAFNLLISFFVRLSQIYPTSYVFSLLVLFYTVRPDCELQTTLGHLLKTSALLFIMYKVFGRYFRIRSLQEETLA